MLLIPAIDIKGGKCVRLRQGRMDDETVFGDDPVKMANRWVEAGTQRLHLVDLDGAAAGEPANFDIIREIAESFPDIDVQIGGGIRSEESIENYLAAGVQYVILGTKAVSAPHFVGDMCSEFPGHVIVGLDAKDGKVAVNGWSKLSSHDVIDLAQRIEENGVVSIVYTDISRDGMLQGVNVENTAKLAESIRIPVIASGGVRNLDDIQQVGERAASGIEGIIAGRSIYEGTLDFNEGLKLAASFTDGVSDYIR